MSRGCSGLIHQATQLRKDDSLAHCDKFWRVCPIIDASNKKIEVSLVLSWLTCLDESIVIF